MGKTEDAARTRHHAHSAALGQNDRDPQAVTQAIRTIVNEALSAL
jgi:hypothetical protein